MFGTLIGFATLANTKFGEGEFCGVYENMRNTAGIYLKFTVVPSFRVNSNLEREFIFNGV